MTLKGRYWILVWLVASLAAALVVTARQRAALELAAALGERRTARRALEARAADLEQRIRAATARGVLDQRVERTLGLRHPDTRNSVTLVRPGSAAPR